MQYGLQGQGGKKKENNIFKNYVDLTSKGYKEKLKIDLKINDLNRRGMRSKVLRNYTFLMLHVMLC